MVPIWLIKTLVILGGCLAAIYLGAFLPNYGEVSCLLLIIAVVCSVCMATNCVPFLLALAMWFPFPPPVPFFSHFPMIALVLMWFYVVIFFRTCLSGTIHYVPSCNLFILACFTWVPIRFLMNPIYKLGGSVEGGHGVSGANAYFLYVLAGVLVILLGSILNTKQRLIDTMLWSFRICFFLGTTLLILAFIPAAAPILNGLGMYDAGNIGDGITRLVVLPGFGLNLLLSSLCPKLFRLSVAQCAVVFLLALAMMFIGGNRASVAAALIAVPLILLLRRKYGLLAAFTVLVGTGVVYLHFTVGQMDKDDIPSLARCLGIFDQKIDEATGGTASAEWRYMVWQSGMEKIMESPLTGQGFGHLSMHLDPDRVDPLNTDFETVLAAGQAHNGFITAAYGFGIPFACGLILALILRMCSHMKSALVCAGGDLEIRDFHAVIAGNFATFGIMIYTAQDLSVPYFWYMVATGIILDRLYQDKVVEYEVPVATIRRGELGEARKPRRRIDDPLVPVGGMESM